MISGNFPGKLWPNQGDASASRLRNCFGAEAKGFIKREPRRSALESADFQYACYQVLVAVFA